MSEWISVTDRMPSSGVPVLVWNKEGFAFIDTYLNWGWSIAWGEDEITHWQPLPEPPKENGYVDDKR